MKRRTILTGGRRPLPLRVVATNGMSASGATEERSLRILHRSALVADLLGGCEFANVTDDAPLPLDEWEVVHDPSSEDRAGSLLAVRRSRGRILHCRYKVGTRPFLGRRRADRMRTRWLIEARLVIDEGTPHEWRPKVLVGHAPPKRNWFLTDRFMESVRRSRAHINLADWNRLPKFVGRVLGRKTRMVHIVGAALRWWIPASKAVAIDVQADHKAVAVTLYP